MLKIKFDHIAIATNSIENTLKVYSILGYKSSKVVVDTTQGVKVCFLRKKGFPCLELVEGIGSDSPIIRIISKIGVSPYHQCFRVNNLESGIKHFKSNGFVMISKISYAPAFNSDIVFLYHRNFGLLELVVKDEA